VSAKMELTPEQKSFVLVLNKAFALIETADALLTDGESLKSVKSRFGEGDHVHIWAKEARGFLRAIKQE
jgi:hypothetical protein